MTTTTVSIIMATFNRAHFIVETLQSIQNQTFKDWECIVIDDGGTDNTDKVIQPFLSNDNRFQFLKRNSNYHKGLPGCRNYGLDLAKGKYIIFFDDDDIIHPQNLSICLSCFESNSIDFCHYAKSPFVNSYPILTNQKLEIEKTITIDDIKDIVTQKIGFASCTVLWKKEVFSNNRFNEKLQYAEEWELFCKLISNGLNGVMLSNILYFNRKHPESNTGEFYNNNPIRRESYAEAVLLVLSNLQQKRLLTNTLKRYFITKSINFTEFNLFKRILLLLEMSTFEKIKWSLFYSFLPFRLAIYKYKKVIKK